MVRIMRKSVAAQHQEPIEAWIGLRGVTYIGGAYDSRLHELMRENSVLREVDGMREVPLGGERSLGHRSLGH